MKIKIISILTLIAIILSIFAIPSAIADYYSDNTEHDERRLFYINLRISFNPAVSLPLGSTVTFSLEDSLLDSAGTLLTAQRRNGEISPFTLNWLRIDPGSTARNITKTSHTWTAMTTNILTEERIRANVPFNEIIIILCGTFYDRTIRAADVANLFLNDDVSIKISGLLCQPDLTFNNKAADERLWIDIVNMTEEVYPPVTTTAVTTAAEASASETSAVISATRPNHDCDNDILDIDCYGSTVTTTTGEPTAATEPEATTSSAPPLEFTAATPETTATPLTTRPLHCHDCDSPWSDCDCDITDINCPDSTPPTTTATTTPPATTTTTVTTTTEPRLKGDVDGDDKITITDALEILKYLAGLTNLLDDCEKSFNAALILPRDEHGKPDKPTIADVLEILKYLAGLNSEIKHIIIGEDGWRWPVESRFTRISQPFGCRHTVFDNEEDEVGRVVFLDEICDSCAEREQGRSRCHNGTDITGSGISGTNIYAMRSGTVREARYGENGGFGYTVIIDHCEIFSTLYAHLNEISVKSEQVVNRGDIIGTVGNTGRSTGPHLHLELRVNNTRFFINGGNGTVINMMQFFPPNVLTR
jgi:murein DD-endopeptidase MepM/ murein hydrolase activator NlpD